MAGDTNGAVDVFVKDRQAAAIARVSVATDGTERVGDSGLDGIAISADGATYQYAPGLDLPSWPAGYAALATRVP